MPLPPSSNAPTPDATSSVKGRMQLTGDLAGTAASPQVAAIHSATTSVNVAAATAPTANQVLTATDSTHATWVTPAGGSGQTLVTKVVAASGGDYTTLSAAITAASSGWCIWVTPGTYTEGGVTSSTTHLSIMGAGNQAVVLNFGSNSLTLSGTGLTLTNMQVNVTTGVLTFTGQNDVIENNIFNRTGTNTATNFINFNSAWSTFSGNNVTDANANTGNTYTFQCAGTRAQVLGNFFCGNPVNQSTSTGAFHFNSGSGEVLGNTFEYNTSSQASVPLVQLDGNAPTTFAGNVINCSSATAAIYCLRVDVQGPITGNYIFGNSGDGQTGILIKHDDAQVVGNYINNVKFGVDINTHNRCSIDGNRITTDSSSGTPIGVTITQGSDNTITSNVISTGSSSCNGFSIVSGGTNGSNNVINGNRINAGSGTAITVGGASATNNIVTSNNTAGSTTSITDTGTTTVKANNV